MPACIRSVKDTFSFEKHEIIVVDNASTDNTRNEIPLLFPEINFIASEKNLGFSAGNNLGIAAARGDYFFLLNPDTEVLSVNVDLWKEKADQKNIIGPRLLNSDKTEQASAWKFPSAVSVFLDAFLLTRFLKIHEYPSIRNFTKVDFISGAAMFFDRRILHKLSGLDPDLFWMDDTDFCYRNKFYGGECFIDPSSIVIHHSGQSTKKDYRIPIANQLISKLKFFQKHGKKASFFFSSIFILAHILIRIILFGVRDVAGGKKDNRLQAYIFTLKKFFRFILFNDRRVT